jgi:hemoglobin
MNITLYEKIGQENIRKLIHDFYQEVRNDELLRPMYKNDLEGAEERLFLFMVQYLGGPDLYNQQRGHPRLRMRHMVFPINEEAKLHWLRNMEVALNKSAIAAAEKDFLWNYFTQTADFLKNR